jgi:magnesium chelatase subunit D
VVLLTDVQANVGRDGTGGRAQAHADALIAARRLAGAQVRALLIDTSLRPQPLAQELAAAMRARYVPLPSADARRLLAAVKSA